MGGKGSGRRPKPTKLKILEGNRGRREIKPEVKPTGVAQRPDFDNAAMALAWDRLTPPLFAMGLATDADQEQLENMCYWWCEMQRARKLPRTSRDTFGQIERSQKMFNNLASSFGMTPRDRVGLEVKTKQAKDETKQFLA